ncbi:MAG: oligosaccharide flippase family protein [Minisyncoccales bacterium]
MEKFKNKIKKILLWSQKYTNTDMIYIARSSFWHFFGKVFYFITSFAIMIAVANWVPKETYGAYRYVLSTVALLSILSLPGLDQSLIRAVAKGKEKMYSVVAKTRLKWSILGTLACFSVSGWYLINQNNALGFSFLIAGLLFSLRYILDLYENFWKGKARFDILNKFIAIDQTLMTLLFLPIIFFTDNLIWLVLGFFGTRIIGHGIFFFITLKKISNNNTDKETIPFGKHLTLMKIPGKIADQIDKVILWQFLGPVAVATFSFAQLPLSKISGLIPISEFSLPKLSKKNIKETKSSLLNKFYKLFLIVVPGIILIVIFIPYFYKLFFPSYLESVPYFRVLSLGLIFTPFTLLSSSFVAAMKKKQLYIINSVIPIARIILFLILIPLYGLWGLIGATLGTDLLKNALIFYFFKKI